MIKRWVRVIKEFIYLYIKFRVFDFLEGCYYEFRVFVENEIGIGDLSLLFKLVCVKDLIGIVLKYLFCFYII